MQDDEEPEGFADWNGRDFDTNPYSPDERRVVDWLEGRCPDIGGGDDPIGFVLASYELLVKERNEALAALRRRKVERVARPPRRRKK